MAEPRKNRFLYLVFCSPRTMMMLFMLIATALLPAAHGGNSPPPFQEGERLVFNLYWGFIKVGEAVMEVLPNTFVDGQQARHFRLKIRTTALVDLIYKVRSEFDALTNMEINRSLRYTKKQLEGGTQKEVSVDFDWQNHTARYVNFGRHEQKTEILPGAFDPLGILYYLRTVNLTAADLIKRPVTDGKRCVVSSLSLMGKERLQLEDVSHDTYTIQSNMRDIEGLFSKSQDSRFTLWFNTDHARTPLMINIELFFGTIVCRLVSATYG